MEIGKIPENVLKRSVLKNITHKGGVVQSGASVGADSSELVFTGEKSNTCLATGSPYIFRVPGTESLALYGIINNLAASGAKAEAVWMNLLLPQGTQEAELKQMMRTLDAACGANGIVIAGGHTEVTEAVSRIVLSVTGIGRKLLPEKTFTGTAQAGLDVVMTKWIGMEGTYLLVKKERQQLEKRLPQRFLDEAERFGEALSVAKEAQIAAEQAVCMHDASKGGILGALWELAEGCRTGLEIDMRRIAVRQETVEVCEQLQLNPYLLDAAGSLLVLTPQGHHLVQRLEQEGIPAAVIGQTTASNDRVLLNEDERRFLELPKPDEIYKILT